MPSRTMGLGGFTDEIATIDMDKSAAAMMSASQQSLDSMTASMTQSMTSATFSSQQFQQVGNRSGTGFSYD